MNLLTTICRAGESDREYDVFWRNGVQNQGLIRITVASSVADPEIVAELSALQWLLERRSVFGVSQAGKGLCLTVSSGAIKKLALAVGRDGVTVSKLGKPHLIPYARFFAARFVGAAIEVSKDASWILPRAMNNVEAVSIDAPLPELVEFASLGVVELSDHALEKFVARQAGGEREDMWRLLRRIATSKLRLATLDQERLLRQQRRHGEAGETWVHDETRWAFIVCPGEKFKRVVTAYAIKQSVAG